VITRYLLPKLCQNLLKAKIRHANVLISSTCDIRHDV
jgi:hypothetical protein